MKVAQPIQQLLLVAVTRLVDLRDTIGFVWCNFRRPLDSTHREGFVSPVFVLIERKR